MTSAFAVHSVLVGFNAFLIVILCVLWFVTADNELLVAALVLLGAGILGKLMKAFAEFVAPRMSMRPLGASECKSFYLQPGASKTGMPSGHAMGAATALVLALYYMDRSQKQTPLMKKFGNIVVAVLSGLIALSRVLYGCHTIAQVFVGYVIGIGYGLLAINHIMPHLRSTTIPLLSEQLRQLG